MTPLEGNMAGASKPLTVYRTNNGRGVGYETEALIHSGSRPVASS